MELNFLYNDGNHFKKLRFIVTDLDYTVPYSQINVNRDGEAQMGWLPRQTGGWKTTVPRYFGSINQKSYYNRIPAELRSKIQHWDGENVYELNKTSSFLGTTVTQGQITNYTGVDLYSQSEGTMKKVCKFGWAYTEIDNPNPGQTGKVPRIWYSGLQTFRLPDDVGEFYGGTLNFGSYNANQAYSESDKPKISLWTIKVQDDITGSPTYGQEFPVLVEAFYQPTGYSTQGAIFIDVRALIGTEDVNPTPNASDPKKNSTPSGWGGNRNVASGSDTITTIPAGMDTTVNWGAHGIFLYATTLTELSELSDILWSDDLITKFKNTMYSPASGIIAIHKIPFTPIFQSMNSEPIKICGLTLENVPVGGYSSVGGAITPNIETATASAWRINRGWQLDSNPIYIEPFFNSFLDFEPYTQISIRLPFIGTVALPTNTCMGGYIKANYLIDCLNGNCIAQIYARSMRNVQNASDGADGWQLIGQYSGNCAMPMAITGNSMGGQAQVGALTGFASNAAGSIISGVATGNAIGAAGGIATSGIAAALSTLTAPKDTKLIGTLSANTTPMTDMTCRVMITRPFDVVPGSWQNVDGQRVFVGTELIEQAGLESFAGGKVSQYSGMTKGLILGDVAGATGEEMNAIRAAFAGGVIV